MSILVRKIYSQNNWLSGEFISDLFDQLITEAEQNNYSGCKLIWWDRYEGWCNMTCDFSTSETIPYETYIEENL